MYNESQFLNYNHKIIPVIRLKVGFILIINESKPFGCETIDKFLISEGC